MHVEAPEDVVLLQSRLFSPGYAGPGRWIIFEPNSRRSFSAVGPDVVPDVVRVLARACGGATTDEIAQEIPEVSHKSLDGLCKAGLLTDGAAARQKPSDSFIACFHRASYNYPFQDYFDPEWRSKEEQLLRYYDSLWPAPPSVTKREGNFRSLPNVELSDLEPGASESVWLSAVLRYTFGAIGQIKTSRVVCLRRTSPSGGARHPTEGVVVFAKSIGDIPPGAYVYDVERHGLVDSPQDDWLAQQLQLENCDFGFIIRSRVERAMWRYREPRAWRPVLMDAGHIIETLSLLLARRGFDSCVLGPPPSSASDLSWLQEPSLAFVAASRDGRTKRWVWPKPDPAPALSNADEYLTNLALYMTFRPGGLRANIIWPNTDSVPIDFVDFAVLNHCLPSNRGDRVTTVPGILDAINGADRHRISRLVECKALISRTSGAQLYAAARLWVRHSWYLSLLAHLEAEASCISAPPVSAIASNNVVSQLDVLLTRRTTRLFSKKTVQLETILSLLDGVVEPSNAAAAADIRVVIGAIEVEGISPGLYEWKPDSSVLGCALRPLARSDARRMAVGQAAAETAASLILIIRTVDDSHAGNYEMQMMDLGRLGQRICLRAEERGLAIFLTPALDDEETLTALKASNPAKSVAYLFALGARHGT